MGYNNGDLFKFEQCAQC